MAQSAAKRAPATPVEAPAEPARAAPQPALADAGATGADPGPALALQAFLAEALEEERPIEGKWSPKQTVGFVAVGCGLLWAVVLGGLAVLT